MVLVAGRHVARKRIEQRARLRLAGLGGLLHLLLDGDVARHQHDAAHALHRLGKRRVGGLQMLRRRARALVHVAHHADALRAQALAQRTAPLGGDRPRVHLADAAADHALARQAALAAPGIVDQPIDLVLADHADHVGDRVGDHLVGVQVDTRQPARTPPRPAFRSGRRCLAAWPLDVHPRRLPRRDVRTTGAAAANLRQGRSCWPGTRLSRLACSISSSSRASSCGSRASSWRPSAGNGPRHCTSMRANGLGM